MSKETAPEAVTFTVPPVPCTFSLKDSCDATLQSAFYGNNYPTVVVLAKQRFKATKDPYYQAIEITARSHGDNPLDRGVGRDVVSKLVGDPNAVIKDKDVLDLYEFACADGRSSYPETIGVLRSRMVKAMPKDKMISTGCLIACIYHSDWLHAQEITVTMEKNCPDVKKFRMFNICATYMYTRMPNCPDKSRNLLTTIAKRKADKEFETRGLLASSDDPSTPISATDQDLRLWVALQIGTHVNKSESIAVLRKHALRILDDGFDHVFAHLLDRLVDLMAWDEAAELCEHVLDKAININQKTADTIDEARNRIQKERQAKNKKMAAELKSGGGQTISTEISDNPTANDSVVSKDEPDDEDDKEFSVAMKAAQDRRSENDETYLRMSRSPRLWRILTDCASNKPNRSQLLKQTRKRLEKLMKAIERSFEAKDLQYSSYNEAMLYLAFQRGRESTEATSGTMVGNIAAYIIEHHEKIPCVDNLRWCIPHLGESDIQTLLHDVESEGKLIETSSHSSLVLSTISYQIRYLIATSVQNSKTCKCCMAVLDEGRSCMQCLFTIARGTLEDYSKAMRNRRISEESSAGYDGDAHINLALVGALSLLRVAEIGYYGPKDSPLLRLDVQFFFQAVVWLDSCLTEWPKNSPLRMLLVKLYLRLGCVSRAKSLWDKFDVKNAILNSLGSIFYDRISTIAPGFFIHGSSTFSAMDPFSHFFTTSIRRTGPKQLTEAFVQENWQSVYSTHQHIEGLKRSCSLVMAVVEERRGLRFKSWKSEGALEDNLLVCNITPNHELKDQTDNAYFPNPGGDGVKPTQEIISYGPGLSHERCHLSLLAERFIDLVNYVQPKEFKACKPGQMMSLDVKYAIETSIHIGHHMDKLLKNESPLSPAEAFYFNIVSVLAHFVNTFLNIYAESTSMAHSSSSRASIESEVSMILTILEAQLINYTSVPSMYHSKIMAFHGFVALHAMGMLRESTIVVRMTASYLTASLLTTSVDKAKAGKKVLSAGETTWASGQLKKLTAEAVKAEKKIEERIGVLKAMMQGGGWIDRLSQWTFDVATARPSSGLPGVPAEIEYRKALATAVKEAIGGDAFFEDWAGRVVDSWNELIRGWSAVKFG